jgi:glutamate formiminotransferase/formiminotetrahydrofolate cyclodeaminase
VASGAQQSFGSLLVDLAAQTPAPGGGSASAWTGALAAALGEMVAGFAGDPEAAARARALRADLVAAGERELSSYAPVLDAVRLPTSEPSRKQRLDAALSEASEAPLAIARASTQVAELAQAIVARSKPSLAGDAVTAVLLAEASSRAAARLVQINLAERSEDPRLSALRELTARAGAAREATLGSE